MAKIKDVVTSVSLKTPQEVWDYYCVVGGFEQTPVDTDTESWIVSLFSEFKEEEFEKVLRDSAGSPAYAVFDANFFRTVLEKLSLRERMLKMEQDMENMKSIDRTKAGQVDLLTQTVAATMQVAVKDLVLSGLQEDFTNWVHSTYGPKYVAPTIYQSANGKTIDGVVNEAFDDVAMWVELDVPVMLTGPAGTGKNVLCQQIGQFFDMPTLVINSIADASELLGYKTIDGTYAETPFIMFTKYCIEKGIKGIVVFDEIDNGDASAMTTVNDGIAARELTLASGEHLVFKDIIKFMACANTWGTGATEEYVGRNQLDAATLNRFTAVEVNYDKKVEESICQDGELLVFLQEFRWAVKNCGIQHIVSYRNITQAVKAFEYQKAKNGITDAIKERILKQCLFKNLTRDDLGQIYRKLGYGTYRNIVERIAEEEY